MGFLSSFFGASPKWNASIRPDMRLKNPELVSELERFRKDQDLDHQLFVHLLSLTQTMLAKWAGLAYKEVQKLLPGRPKSDHFAMLIGDKITKKCAALLAGDISIFAKPKSREELESLIEDIEMVGAHCSTIGDVVRYLIKIEEEECQYDDPLGYIRAIDSICFRYIDIYR
jgi:hypothetical protein